MHINSELNKSYSLDVIPKLVKKLPLVMIIVGTIISFLVYFKFYRYMEVVKKKMKIPILFLRNKCYIDELYELIVIKPSLYLGRGFWKSIDIDLIDNLGPNGMSRMVSMLVQWFLDCSQVIYIIMFCLL